MSTSITCTEREQEQMLLLLRSLLGYILRRETKGPTSSVMKKSIDRRSHHNIKGLIPAILTQVTVHRGQSGWHWPQKQVLTIQRTESCWAITPLDWNKLTNQFHQGDDFFGRGGRREADPPLNKSLHFSHRWLDKSWLHHQRHFISTKCLCTKLTPTISLEAGLNVFKTSIFHVLILSYWKLKMLFNSSVCCFVEKGAL